MSHVDHKHKGEPINNLDKGDNTETKEESKDCLVPAHSEGGPVFFFGREGEGVVDGLVQQSQGGVVESMES